MQFHSFPDTYHLIRENAAVRKHILGGDPPDPQMLSSADIFYGYMTRMAGSGHATDRMLDHSLRTAYHQWRMEWAWLRDNRPYYHVWPGIVAPLTKLNHKKVLASDIQMPRQVINFQFPVKSELFALEHEGQTYSLRSVLVGDFEESITWSGHTLPKKRDRVLTLWMDFGETEQLCPYPITTYRRFPIEPGMTLEEAMGSLKTHDSIHFGIPFKEEVTTQVVRLVAAICLLSQDKDEELVEPDVLNGDYAKWQETGDPKYVERAHRRGKLGWIVGRHWEVNPHYRTQHLMHLKAGVAGREVARIVKRRGSIVKRAKAQQLPTGELGD